LPTRWTTRGSATTCPTGTTTGSGISSSLLKALFRQASTSGIATNPFKLDQVIRQVGSNLTVDTGGLSLADLVFALRRIGPGDLTGVRVPSYATDIDDTSYVLLEAEATGLFTAIRTGELSAWAAGHPTWVNPI